MQHRSLPSLSHKKTNESLFAIPSDDGSEAEAITGTQQVDELASTFDGVRTRGDKQRNEFHVWPETIIGTSGGNVATPETAHVVASPDNTHAQRSRNYQFSGH